jgi:hypothetical protein
VVGFADRAFSSGLRSSVSHGIWTRGRQSRPPYETLI